MAPKPKIKVVPIEAAKLQSLRELAKAHFAEEDAALFSAALDTLEFITSELQRERMTMARLRRLFGLRKSEKLSSLPTPTPAANQADASTQSGPAAPNSDQPAEPASTDRAPKAVESAELKRKGHGRIAASEYTAATHIPVPHATLHAGDTCCECGDGKLYRLSEPCQILRIVGQAPLHAISWDCEQLRCSSCLAVITAKAPPEAQGPKHSESAAAMIGTLRYGTGVPHNRLEGLQQDLGAPMPASTQWEVVNEHVEALRPVHGELERRAAEASMLHTDDTSMPILQFMGKRRAKLLAAGKLEKPERTGMFTTGIVAVTSEGPIVLFRTGRAHAGENLADLLDKRPKDLAPPLHMSDALNRNEPGDHPVDTANCLAHARRNFVEQYENFPEQCRYLIEQLAELYAVDVLCRKLRLTADQRLAEHQKRSAPVLDKLHATMTADLDNKRVEPSSGLGQAYNYMLKRWSRFTRFLHVPGAPLDNNTCERALKKAILHRNGSLFYRSAKGADVGDVYMSLIHTAERHDKNPHHYLTTLMLHEKEVRAAPADWLPWTYEATLARMAKRGDAAA